MPDNPLRHAIIVALLEAGLRVVPDQDCLLEDIVCFWPDVLDVLALDRGMMDLQDEETLLGAAEVHVRVVNRTVRIHEVIDNLSVWSTLPACEAYWHWMCREFMPAIMRHGYYEPSRNHVPPPHLQLDALERREHGRDLFDAILPGLGHPLSENEDTTW